MYLGGGDAQEEIANVSLELMKFLESLKCSGPQLDYPINSFSQK